MDIAAQVDVVNAVEETETIHDKEAGIYERKMAEKAEKAQGLANKQ